MERFNFICVFSLLLLIEFSAAVPDGMVSCAWGKYKRSHRAAETYDIDIDLASMREKVLFLYYNKEHPYAYQIFLDDKDRLQSQNFDPKKPTKIMIHGYGSSQKSSSCVLTTEALLKNGDFNIIIVDWSKVQHWHGILSPYPQVVKKVPKVAEYVRLMIEFLESYGVDMRKTTLIGHSLGAHIAGITGYNMKNKPYRLVGLDPAAPYFSSKGPGERLSKESAKTVEVIHTEIDECGLNAELGHYDFYPNSGRMQPGCEKYKCSHSRSYRYFAESLSSPNQFYARKCEDWSAMQNGMCKGEEVLMGGLERTQPIPEGIYYLRTNAEPPYAKGHQ